MFQDERTVKRRPGRGEDLINMAGDYEAARDQILERFSVASFVASLPEAEREHVLAGIPTGMLGPYAWGFWSRPEQRWPRGEWRTWLILAGRGLGKTRTGSETIRLVATRGWAERIALVGETEADVRGVMIEGPDGILARSPRRERPLYEPSKRRLTWWNGVVASTYSGAAPEQLRGPQHGFAWVDELAKFKYAREMWDNLSMGLRMEERPHCLVTTTPRPIKLLRELLACKDGSVYVTHGTTFDNALNLPGTFIDDVIRRYRGTTIGRQELMAEMLDEMPGALWRRRDVDACRCEKAPELVRVLVGVDPSVSESGEGALCGIVAAGIDSQNPCHGYVLEDASVRGSPQKWAERVAQVYRKHRANIVVAEGNQGGALVREVLWHVDSSMPVVVVYASRGKAARAEPVAMLYEQGRIHHVGVWPELEDELVTWVPGMASPNRLDALVWAFTELTSGGGGEVIGEII